MCAIWPHFCIADVVFGPLLLLPLVVASSRPFLCKYLTWCVWTLTVFMLYLSQILRKHDNTKRWTFLLHHLTNSLPGHSGFVCLLAKFSVFSFFFFVCYCACVHLLHSNIVAGCSCSCSCWRCCSGSCSCSRFTYLFFYNAAFDLNKAAVSY